MRSSPRAHCFREKCAEADIEFGLYSFGDLTADPHSRRTASARERLAEIVAAAQLAEEAGLDVFALGEHHRQDFAVAAPSVVLAAIAAVTKRIRLSTAVTVLPTVDPVRVFEEFATLDLLSGGRAEIVAGRGIFTEPFPLFGYDVPEQDALFAEHLELLLKLNAEARIERWEGRFRPPLRDADIAPRPERPLPIWVGTGGTPASAVRAGRLGLPLSLGNITKPPSELAPVIHIYRQAGAEAGHPASALRVAVSKHMYLAADSRTARNEFYPYYAAYFRGHTPPQYSRMEVTRELFEQRAAPQGALCVGSPQEIIDKILHERSLFGHDRFMAQIDIGGLPYAKVAEVIELLATEVVPVVRRETGL